MTGENTNVTPDGRYFVVRGRLWRCANPALPERRRAQLVSELMQPRRELRRTRKSYSDDAAKRAAVRARVQAIKEALGERGPVWWDDGAPDYNRRMAVNTPYRDWFLAKLEPSLGKSNPNPGKAPPTTGKR
jgi:predicted aminopeptidase